jgi:hypothetical protein
LRGDSKNGDGKRGNGNGGSNGNSNGNSDSTIGGNVGDNTTSGDNTGICKTVSIANVEVDSCQPLAMLVGVAVGLQTDKSVAGSCVYASVAVIVMGNVYIDTLITVLTDLS